MKSKIRILLLFFGFITAHGYAQEVQNISVLFDSLKVSPANLEQRFAADKALQYKKIATGNLYPKIFAFGKYNYSSSPSGILPIPPNDMIKMIHDPSVAQPFSENIL